MLTDQNRKALYAFINEYEFLKIWKEEIVTRYSEPHRKYHTLEHIKLMLDARDKSVQSYTATSIQMSLGDCNLIQAIVLHDIVYSPFPQPLGINEYYSAQWAEHHGADKEVLEAIIATSCYLCDQRHLSIVAMELCDLDLANLALSYEEYSYWASLALEEAAIIYGVDHVTLLRGQAGFCNAMLERAQIYYRHSEWEDRARWNLEQKISELESLLDANAG